MPSKSVIDKLPERERQKVIDALIAGQSLRQVASIAGVSHTQVAEYKRRVLVPALETARKVNALQAVAQTPTDQVVSVSTLTRAVAQADPFIARVEKLRADRERAKSMAIDSDKPDLKAWASLDRNDLSELELHARLAGRLDSGAQGAQVAIQIVCPAGGAPEVTARGTDGVTLDITPSK